MIPMIYRTSANTDLMGPLERILMSILEDSQVALHGRISKEARHFRKVIAIEVFS
jgi:hypothetical protein